LDQVADVDIDTTIPLLYLKVVFLSTEQKGKYTMYKTAMVKDIKCQRHFLRLYGDIRSEVRVGDVYSSQTSSKARTVPEDVSALLPMSALEIIQWAAL
jgi:hypothetical protein